MKLVENLRTSKDFQGQVTTLVVAIYLSVNTGIKHTAYLVVYEQNSGRSNKPVLSWMFTSSTSFETLQNKQK